MSQVVLKCLAQILPLVLRGPNTAQKWMSLEPTYVIVRPLLYRIRGACVGAMPYVGDALSRCTVVCSDLASRFTLFADPQGTICVLKRLDLKG